jgi:hypothetical protein
MAAVGATALASSAGCLGILGGGGGGHKQWLPEPGTLGDGDHYSFSLVNYSSLEQHEDEFDDDTDLGSVEDTWQPADVNWEDVTMYLRFQGMTVLNAKFDSAEIVESFEDEDWDDATEHEGYTVMLSSDETRAVGVGNNTLVSNGFGFGGSDDPVDAVEDVVDTKKGEEDRYVAESEDFSTVVNKVGSGDIVSAGSMEETGTDEPESGQFRDQVGQGRALTVNGETTKGKWVLLFKDGDDVDLDDVQDWVETSQDEDGRFEDWEDMSYNKNGRAAVVTGKVDTDRL